MIRNAKGPFIYYVTQKNEFLDPPPLLSQIFQRNKFILFKLSQNLRTPPPVTRNVIHERLITTWNNQLNANICLSPFI